MKRYIRSSKYDDHQLNQSEIDSDDKLLKEIIHRWAESGKAKLPKSMQANLDYLEDKYNIVIEREFGGRVRIAWRYNRSEEASWSGNHELEYRLDDPKLDKINIIEQVCKKFIRNKDTYKTYSIGWDDGKTYVYPSDYKDAYYNTGYWGRKPTYQDSVRKSENIKLRQDHAYRYKFRKLKSYGDVVDADGIALASEVEANRDSIQTREDKMKLANRFHVPITHVIDYINFYDNTLNDSNVPDYLKQ